MQPQSPSGPNPQFDFMLKDQGKQRRSLPSFSLPKPVLISACTVVVIIILVVLFSLLSGSKNKDTNQITSLMAEAQEISRASGLINQQSKDANVTALASTVSTALSSQQAQLSNYLTSTGHKVDAKLLSADQNTGTDTLFQTAAQNNNLASTYNNYLKQNLTNYKTMLANEYNSTPSKTLKDILNNAAASINTILSSLNS